MEGQIEVVCNAMAADLQNVYEVVCARAYNTRHSIRCECLRRRNPFGKVPKYHVTFDHVLRSHERRPVCSLSTNVSLIVVVLSLLHARQRTPHRRRLHSVRI